MCSTGRKVAWSRHRTFWREGSNSNVVATSPPDLWISWYVYRLSLSLWVYSSACQNLAAISKVAISGDLAKILLPKFWQLILATYLGMPNFGNFFCHEKVAISKSCHLGGLRKIFAARILATYFGMPNFGMPKSGNFFGSHFKSCQFGGT